MKVATELRTLSVHAIFNKSLLLASCAVLLLSMPAFPQVGPHQDSPEAARVRTLNGAVLALHGQMQHASGNEAALLRGQAAPALAKRAAALQKLVQTNPREALSFAFSPELLAELATKFSQSTSLLEWHGTLVGQVEQWIADYPGGKPSRTIWRMNANGRKLNLHFAGPSPETLDSEQVLQVTGVVAGEDMAVATSVPVASSAVSRLQSHHAMGENTPTPDQPGPTLAFLMGGFIFCLTNLAGTSQAARAKLRALLKQFAIGALVFAVVLSSSKPSLAQSSCSTTGAQKVAVLLVTYPGVTPPANITPQSVYEMFFGTTGPSLDGYWREASYGQTSASGNVFGWYTLDSSYADCSRLDLLRDAAITAAANAGVNFQNYNRIFIVTTDFACGWTGMAMGQCTTLTSPNGSFVASTALLSASWQRSQLEGAGNAAHEGGHNFGLGHAQLRTFGSEPLGALGAAGTLTEYGDYASAMSCSNAGHYAAPHKAEALGWIAPGDYQAVQTSGSYTIAPFEPSAGGPQALKVQRGTGNTGYYLWIEYREPVGSYDSTLSPPPPAGALIHYEDATTGSRTQLINFAPNTALMPGASWADPYTDLSLSVASATPAGLTVNVTYSGSVTCKHANPTVNISPANPSLYAGSTVNYNLSVTNNDPAACPASTFGLSSSQPSGWIGSLSAATVALAPGQNTSVTMTQTSPSGTLPGTYPITAAAASGTYSGSAAANATVMVTPALTASVSVPSSSYSRKSTVAITATVLNGGTPAPGASVTFTLRMANGKTATQSATAGSSGTATWSYKLAANSPTGIYSVAAKATVSGVTASSNTATFTVY